MPARLHVGKFLELLAPAFAQRDQKKLHYPARAESPVAVGQSVLVIDLAATDQALAIARGAIVQPAPSAGVLLASNAVKPLRAASPTAKGM